MSVSYILPKRELIFFVGVFIAAFALRFGGQPNYPACLHRDEVQFAYNAYSILQTGRDEWGEILPLHFKFNGEYHVPVIFYLTALVQAVTGPTDVSVRLPAILLDSLIPIVAYLLAKRWFGKPRLAAILALLLVVNPWHLVNARGSGQISVLSLFFGLTGFLLLSTYLHTHRLKLFFSSCVCFLITYFSYIASRFDIPLLLSTFLILFYRQFPRKNVVLPILIGVILFPFVLVAIYPKRFVGTSVIAKHFLPEETDQIAYVQGYKTLGLSRFVAQQSKTVFLEITDNYFDYLHPYYVFRNLGEPIRTNIKDTGPLYLVEFLFVGLGLVALANVRNRSTKWFFISWLILTPLVGAMTYNTPDRPNTARTVFYYFGLSVLSAWGIWYLTTWWQSGLAKKWLAGGIILVFAANGYFFYRQFTQYTVPTLSQVRSCGFQTLFTKTETIKNTYDYTVVGTEYDYPYIQYLWYTRYPPDQYHRFLQQHPGDIPVFIHTKNKSDWQLENYVYTHDSCPLSTQQNVLIVGNFQDCYYKKQIKVFKDPNSNHLIFHAPDKELHFLLIDRIPRPDGSIVFDLYTPTTTKPALHQYTQLN